MLTTQSTLHYTHSHSQTRTQLYTDAQIGRQLNVKCLSQRHLNIFQAEALIKFTTLQLKKGIRYTLSHRYLHSYSWIVVVLEEILSGEPGWGHFLNGNTE